MLIGQSSDGGRGLFMAAEAELLLLLLDKGPYRKPSVAEVAGLAVLLGHRGMYDLFVEGPEALLVTVKTGLRLEALSCGRRDVRKEEKGNKDDEKDG